MVLRYMVSDTDLSKGKFVQPEKRPVRPVREIVRPRNSVSLPKRRVKFWFLLAANVIVFIVIYHIWTGKGKLPGLEFIAASRLTVTGILYNAENPSAIVSSEVVREGDTIHGCRIVKIHRDKIEFEKKGRIFTKRVRQ